ncbi:MAG: HIT family protein [Phycisphaerales bacterium]
MTIFARIIKGEIPCHKVYEDAHTIAFLDINPLSRGHTLVVPKEPAVTLDELSADSAAALGRALARVARAVRIATGTPEYNILQNNGSTAGQVVMHVHFHIIPRPANATGPGGPGLSVTWPARTLAKEDATTLATAIAAAAAK